MSRRKSKTDVARLDKMKDEDIDYSDIPELDEEMFKGAKLVIPASKGSVTMRLDRDVLD